METISQAEYLALKEGAKVLEADPWGEKVLRLADGTILKLFRRKRWFSSATLYPYAKRFVANAKALARLGIPVPDILRIVRIPSIGRDAVHYAPLAGETLRELVRAGLDPAHEVVLKAAFTRFVIGLHDNGVYFRSLHIGNVVCTPEGKLGLIDFSDLRIYRRPLPTFMRRRNIQRMLGIAGERDWIDSEAILKARSA